MKISAGLSNNAVVYEELIIALRRLDRLLEKAISQANIFYGSRAAADAFRGLHLDQDEMRALLVRDPGAPHLWKEGSQELTQQASIDNLSALAWLQQTYNLSSFDIDVLLIALAPEIDLRYERLYAYLQDDVTKKRPTVDLALNLLSPSTEAKLIDRNRFASNAPLIAHDLLQLIPDPHQPHPTLLTHYLKLDNQIVHLLLGQSGLDSRLESFCEWVEPAEDLDELPLDSQIKQSLSMLVRQQREERQPLQLYLQGPTGMGKRQCAEALSSQLGMPLLVAHVERLLNKDPQFNEMLTPLFREAWFNDAILLLQCVDALFDDQGSPVQEKLMQKLAEDSGITILTGRALWPSSLAKSAKMISISFHMPDYTHRQACWENSLARYGTTIDDAAQDALTERFRLTPRQINDATATAFNQARWRLACEQDHGLAEKRSPEPSVAELFSAARAQSGHDLAALAQKIEPLYTWKDLILPEDTLTQLHEICQRVVHRHKVLGEWGFDRKLSLGKGVNALFAGPSGVGKTMAAEVITHELGLDLYKIDLSGVVSKYIGETEKNLDRVFTAAENANAILLFDEADALFGKRSEVRDSHDRYANIETSYLLQKMEQFDGIALLSTNQRQNLDTAFTRRLAFTVHFPFPDEAGRQKIWEMIWPTEIPLAADVDLKFLASQFKLSGGNIKNIALAASFLAAGDSGSIAMAHLLQAIRREYQKMGKIMSEDELIPHASKPVQKARDAA